MVSFSLGIFMKLASLCLPRRWTYSYLAALQHFTIAILRGLKSRKSEGSPVGISEKIPLMMSRKPHPSSK